jgi:hypothetical protein
VIDLTLSLFPWAKFRKTKGAIKLHTRIDLRGNIPAFLTITDGKVHDVKAAPQVPIEAEGIYVVDRGYVDFAWLWSIHQAHAFFVMRLKRSIRWTRVSQTQTRLPSRAKQAMAWASTRSACRAWMSMPRGLPLTRKWIGSPPAAWRAVEAASIWWESRAAWKPASQRTRMPAVLSS